ncbi:MAG: histone methyltransferase set2 [Caeruleum heppii]|nr:MAG: histone methyltransferase set2 [Caeruleum heppii]
MADEEKVALSAVVESSLEEMKIESGATSDDEKLDTIRVGTMKTESPTSSSDAKSPLPDHLNSSQTSSPALMDTSPKSPSPTKLDPAKIEEKVGGDISIKVEPGKTPKLSRTSSQKVIARPPPIFDHLPDATPEATSTFQLIHDCNYGSKYLGSSEQEALGCDCAEEWEHGRNGACGGDSDCINRLTKIECTDSECGCGSACQNQRFQLKQYAKVSVIKTEKKGYGLRADTDLLPHDFIYEYIGDVINESTFRRRMVQYDEEGVKHFYFMSLQKNVFVDATRRGNLGRFCNHSCNPNCYVDKWVVGDKLRMGIFTERKIKAGEELVFNYNVDRYGADPQPCYCGEPNCTGFLGGKTQTERATKLSLQVQEALGIEDGDGWDTAVAKRPKKKKTEEDDEEYVDRVEPKSLDEDGVTKVMATLMQCKEKWIVVKLLSRIQRCDTDRVRNRVVKMHGYQILHSTLSTWKEDFNIVLQIFDILDKLPRLTRNKISDSKIETTVEHLTSCGDEGVQSQAAALLKEWAALEVGYRIPRKKREPNSTSTPDRPDRFDRRGSPREDRTNRSKTRSRSRSPDFYKRPSAPTGPRNNVSMRGSSYSGAPRPPFPRRPFHPLPHGWFANQANGKTYYYSASGQTTWTRPTMPAAQPPPPPKVVSHEQKLQEIIDNITKERPKELTSASVTPQPAVEAPKEKKEGKEKWRSYNEDKRKKLYENTLFPHIKYVMDKFKSKLPKDDLKRFAKEVSKKLVNSDFKHNRVEDPTRISSRQEKQVKKYVKEYFDKAVAKKRAHEKKKAEKSSQQNGIVESPSLPTAAVPGNASPGSDDDQAMAMSDVEPDDEDVVVPSLRSPEIDESNGDVLKRKRDAEGHDGADPEGFDGTPSKRARSASPPIPPPPPPPPPAGSPLEDEDPFDEEGDSAEVSVRFGQDGLADTASNDGLNSHEAPILRDDTERSVDERQSAHNAESTSASLESPPLEDSPAGLKETRSEAIEAV